MVIDSFAVCAVAPSCWNHTFAQFILLRRSSEYYPFKRCQVPVGHPVCVCIYIYSLLWRCGQTRVRTSSFLRFLDHTQRRIIAGRTPLGALSARRRDIYLTTHNTHNRETSMPLVGFEPTISGGERPQTYALDRAATGTGSLRIYITNIYVVYIHIYVYKIKYYIYNTLYIIYIIL